MRSVIDEVFGIRKRAIYDTNCFLGNTSQQAFQTRAIDRILLIIKEIYVRQVVQNYYSYHTNKIRIYVAGKLRRPLVSHYVFITPTPDLTKSGRTDILET